MPKPETVKQSQTFVLDKVIYNHNGFSVGVGKYLGKDLWAVSMRWNGYEDKAGFPYAGKHPLWFTIPVELSPMFLKGLLESKNILKDEYLQVLEYLKDFTDSKFSKEQRENYEEAYKNLLNFD